MIAENSETTNAVLKETINGLIDLSNERFLGIKESLTRIETSAHGYATKIELEEVKKDFNATIKRVEEGFVQHNKDDKESFGELAQGQKQVRETLIRGGAIIVVLLFILSFLSPVILRYFFHI